MSNARISMATGDMLNMLGNAMLFTSKDASTPVLSNIMIEPQGERVAAVATDRYRVAWVDLPMIRFESDHEGEMPSLLLPSKLSDSFVKALKGLKRDLLKATDWNMSARGDIPDGRLAHLDVEFRGETDQKWTLTFPGGALSGLLEYGGHFPKLRQLFAEHDADDAVSTFALSPTLLASFTKVKDLVPNGEKNLPLNFIAGKFNKPITIQYSNWFEGLQMPVRLPENQVHSKRAA